MYKENTQKLNANLVFFLIGKISMLVNSLIAVLNPLCQNLSHKCFFFYTYFFFSNFDQIEDDRFSEMLHIFFIFPVIKEIVIFRHSNEIYCTNCYVFVILSLRFYMKI